MQVIVLYRHKQTLCHPAARTTATLTLCVIYFCVHACMHNGQALKDLSIFTKFSTRGLQMGFSVLIFFHSFLRIQATQPKGMRNINTG